MTTTPQPSTDKRREEIARIADPDLWRSRDILLNQAQMYRDAPADEVEPNGYARFAEQREQAAASVIEPSLAKADAIMALFANRDQSPEPVQNLHEFADEARCDDCGGENPVWFAPNAVWNFVLGGPLAKDDPGGFLCPTCFIARAEAAGITPTAWELRPEPPSNTETGTRDGGGL